MANTPPELSIPASATIVDVSIIDTTASIKGVKTENFMGPAIKGHDVLSVPVYAFLVQHHDPSTKTTRRLLFDLGIRKDWWNLAPAFTDAVRASSSEITVKKSVRQIIEAESISGESIEAIIWSHWHWDHTGNPPEFPFSTSLVVGPGFKANMLPGYPTNPESPVLDSDFVDRQLIELDFKNDSRAGFKIGQFTALDYFGDGSFYLLDAPGHAIGHICGLARVTSKPDSFIFMGGDAAHQAGEWRPSQFLPLPKQITPHPFTKSRSACPGEMFESLLPNGPEEPFYLPAKLETGQIHLDVDEAIRTVQKMQEADGQAEENIFVVVAHDETLLDVVDFFPAKANDFMKKGWVQKARWGFLSDFAEAVGYEGEVVGKRDWHVEAKVGDS